MQINSKSSENAENAFSKIDKKNESLFTKDERKRNYKNSIAAAEENKKPINQLLQMLFTMVMVLQKKGSKKIKQK